MLALREMLALSYQGASPKWKMYELKWQIITLKLEAIQVVPYVTIFSGNSTPTLLLPRVMLITLTHTPVLCNNFFLRKLTPPPHCVT